jgi:hypothetical protein
MRMIGARASLAGVLFLLAGARVSPAVAADEEGALAAPAPSSGASWYGYQTVSADATAAALTALSFQTNSGAASWAAIGVYLLGAPVVHAAHQRPLAALGSLGLRIGMPLLAAAVGAATADCSSNRVLNDENCEFGPSVVGAGIGLILAAVIDSAAIAWDPPSSPGPYRPAAVTEPWSIRLLAPSPVPMRNGAGFAVGGLF